MDRRATQNGLPFGVGRRRFSTATKTEFNSEPIRLTFDASKAFWGPKYSQFVDLWVAYRYWQNKFGLDHNADAGRLHHRGNRRRAPTAAPNRPSMPASR